MKSKVLFIADYGPKIGSGHRNRCLALAERFRRTHEVVFGDRNMIRRLAPGIVVWDLFDPSQLDSIKEDGAVWAVFEDWNRVRRKDVVIINPNIFAKSFRRANGQALLGPKYYPLKSELTGFQKPRVRVKTIQKVLVTFGGHDRHHLALRVVKALEGVKVSVISGALDRRIQFDFSKVSTYHNVPAAVMYRLIRDHDLVITAGGVTVYESLCVGTPAVLVAQNELQARTASCFARRGLAVYLGEGSQLTETRLKSKLAKVLKTRLFAPRVVDGKGAERIYQFLIRKEKTCDSCR